MYLFFDNVPANPKAEIKLLKLPSPSEPGASQCRLCTALLRTDFSVSYIIANLYCKSRNLPNTDVSNYRFAVISEAPSNHGLNAVLWTIGSCYLFTILILYIMPMAIISKPNRSHTWIDKEKKIVASARTFFLL